MLGAIDRTLQVCYIQLCHKLGKMHKKLPKNVKSHKVLNISGSLLTT